MVLAYDIRFDMGRTQAMFRKLPREIQVNLGNALFDIGKDVERSLKRQLQVNKSVWRGKLLNSIRAKKMSDNRTIITMNQEGFWLDNARPHAVALRRGRLITRWASDHGIRGVRYLYVRPHPFILRGFSRARKNIPKRLQKRITDALNNSRR
jgi:hypothetical protein